MLKEKGSHDFRTIVHLVLRTNPWNRIAQRKLDQWEIFFDHAESLGFHLTFKLQEAENDDGEHALDDGGLGPERRLSVDTIPASHFTRFMLLWCKKAFVVYFLLMPVGLN